MELFQEQRTVSSILGHALPAGASGRAPHPAVALVFGVLTAGGLWLGLEERAQSTRFEAGLVFTGHACDLSPGIARQLGGALTPDECATVERTARAEIAAAFEGLRLGLTVDPHAFWAVHVVDFVPARTRMLGATGASIALGPLGGRGIVGLGPIAGRALHHLPPDTPRAELVAAIGRGVGRSVVHELAHQIAGGAVDGSDPETYEYASADRAAQYSGRLRWGAAGARVQARLGR